MKPQVLQYLSRLSALAPETIYLVGGPVRDMLIGLDDIKDIDIVVRSGSETIARAFADIIGGTFFFLDEERKITRVVKNAGAGHIQFDFTDFVGRDLHEDLARRDFTINAIALDVRDFLTRNCCDDAIDPFGGKQDILDKRIRMTGAAVFEDDPLRMLRAVRFAAALRFTIENGTREQMRASAELITQPAPERIRDELFQILSLPGSGNSLLLMDELGLLSRLLPELDTLTGFSPGKYHTYDVRTHSIKTAHYVDEVLADLPRIAPQHAARVLDHLGEELEYLVPRKAALRFSCLLHDIGKPETLSRDEEGHIHFYSHDKLGALKAKDICGRFRLSRAAETAITTVIRQHMRLFNLSAPGGPSKNAMYRYCRDMGDALPESLILAQADARSTRDILPAERFTDTEKTMAIVLDYYFEKFLRTEAKPFVNGHDLIDRGLRPGPRFRDILDDIRERQASGELKDREDALRFLDRAITSMQ